MCSNNVCNFKISQKNLMYFRLSKFGHFGPIEPKAIRAFSLGNFEEYPILDTMIIYTHVCCTLIYTQNLHYKYRL